MKEVGAYKAKTHLPALLEKVSKGQTIAITKHGVRIALIVPASVVVTRPIAETISGMRAFRRNVRLGKASIKRLIEEGRR